MGYRIERGLLAALNLLKSRGIDAQRLHVGRRDPYGLNDREEPLGPVDVFVELYAEEYLTLNLSPTENEEEREEIVEIVSGKVHDLFYRKTIKGQKIPAVVFCFRAYGIRTAEQNEEE
jgi:hypothetical protein